MVYKYTEDQLEAIKQYEEAKEHFELMEKKYDLVVKQPLFEYAMKLTFEDGEKSRSFPLPSGSKLIYMRPTSYWGRKKKYTTEYLVSKLPEAFEFKMRKHSIKLIRNA